jgi:hypothetical protein
MLRFQQYFSYIAMVCFIRGVTMYILEDNNLYIGTCLI